MKNFWVNMLFKYVMRLIVAIECIMLAAFITVMIGVLSYLITSIFIVIFLLPYLLYVERRIFPYRDYKKN